MRAPFLLPNLPVIRPLILFSSSSLRFFLPVAGQAVRAEGADLLPVLPDEHLLHHAAHQGACGLRREGAALLVRLNCRVFFSSRAYVCSPPADDVSYVRRGQGRPQGEGRFFCTPPAARPRRRDMYPNFFLTKRTRKPVVVERDNGGRVYDQPGTLRVDIRAAPA